MSWKNVPRFGRGIENSEPNYFTNELQKENSKEFARTGQ